MKVKMGIVALCVLGGVSVATGCTYAAKGEGKKIVVEEDVRQTLKAENNIQVCVEEISLPLENGGYFWPIYYDQGNVYGKISRGLGRFDGEES